MSPCQIVSVVAILLALVGFAHAGGHFGGFGGGHGFGGGYGGGHGGFVAAPVSFGHGGGFGGFGHGGGHALKVTLGHGGLGGFGGGHGYGHGGWHRSLVHGPVKVKGDIHSAKKYAPLAYGHGW